MSTLRDEVLDEVQAMLEEQRNECLQTNGIRNTEYNAIRAEELDTALINLRVLRAEAALRAETPTPPLEDQSLDDALDARFSLEGTLTAIVVRLNCAQKVRDLTEAEEEILQMARESFQARAETPTITVSHGALPGIGPGPEQWRAETPAPREPWTDINWDRLPVRWRQINGVRVDAETIAKWFFQVDDKRQRELEWLVEAACGVAQRIIAAQHLKREQAK